MPDFTNPQEFNRYAYCLNNPLRYTDPDGHQTDVLYAALQEAWRWSLIQRGLEAPPSTYTKVVLPGQIGSWLPDRGGTEKLAGFGHGALDTAGLLPGAGEFFDAANAAWYGFEGDYANAAYSAGAMVPILGWLATGTKWGNKILKGAGEAVSNFFQICLEKHLKIQNFERQNYWLNIMKSM